MLQPPGVRGTNIAGSVLSAPTGPAAGKSPAHRAVFFHCGQGKESGPCREANSVRLKIGLCHGQSQNSGKSELVAFRKHSLLHLGVTKSDLWKSLEHPAEPDFCLRDLAEEQAKPRSREQRGLGLRLGRVETPKGLGAADPGQTPALALLTLLPRASPQ